MARRGRPRKLSPLPSATSTAPGKNCALVPDEVLARRAEAVGLTIEQVRQGGVNVTQAVLRSDTAGDTMAALTWRLTVEGKRVRRTFRDGSIVITDGMIAAADKYRQLWKGYRLAVGQVGPFAVKAALLDRDAAGGHTDNSAFDEQHEKYIAQYRAACTAFGGFKHSKAIRAAVDGIVCENEPLPGAVHPDNPALIALRAGLLALERHLIARREPAA